MVTILSKWKESMIPVVKIPVAYSLLVHVVFGINSWFCAFSLCMVMFEVVLYDA